jgi:hypothetical protein
MISVFFYNKLTNIELIKKINNNFEICDGYIIIQNYDIENNILEINEKSMNNNKILYGKIVNFKTTINDILKKINELQECMLENRIKYKLETIWANKIFGGTCKTYIIY